MLTGAPKLAGECFNESTLRCLPRIEQAGKRNVVVWVQVVKERFGKARNTLAEEAANSDVQPQRRTLPVSSPNRSSMRPTV